MKTRKPNHKSRAQKTLVGNDASWISDAAIRLGISELRLFEVAYEQWYDEPIEAESIKSHYLIYKSTGSVPVWARHFCRKVMKLDRENALDPSEFGIVTASLAIERRNFRLEISAAAIILVIACIYISEVAIGLIFIVVYFTVFYYILYLGLQSEEKDR